MDEGRFLSEDPARDGVNWFAFVGNNPLTYTDPTGLFGLDANGNWTMSGSSAWEDLSDTVVVDGDRGRAVRVTTDEDKGTTTVKILDGSQTVHTSEYSYEEGESRKDIINIEGLYNKKDYGAGKIIINEDGMVASYDQANTLPSDRLDDPMIKSGIYEYKTDYHNLGNPTIDPGEPYYNNGQYRYKANRIRMVGTDMESPIPGVMFSDKSRIIEMTGYINDHAGNQGGTGAARRASTGCVTTNPAIYPSYINNFNMGDRGFFEIFRY